MSSRRPHQQLTEAHRAAATTTHRFVLLLQRRGRWVHLCVRLGGEDKRPVRYSQHRNISETNSPTFWTWLISSCFLFWLRVIFLSGWSPRSPTPPISELFLTASFTVLVSASRDFPTHSSRRRLTGSQTPQTLSPAGGQTDAAPPQRYSHPT